MIDHAVILAIGHPNHTSQLTHNRTHAMLPALGKPLIVRIMNRLYQTGIRNYTVIVGRNEGAVASYLNNQWMPDVNVQFLPQFGNDSLLKILKQSSEQHQSPFVICAYNCFTHVHFPERLLRHYDSAEHGLVLSGTLNTLSKATRQYYARVNGRQIEAISQEAPDGIQLINFAVCGIKLVEFLRQRPDTQQTVEFGWQFIDIAQQYLNAGGQAHLAETSWALQVENDQDLLTLNRHLLEENTDANILSDLPYTVKIIPPVRIDPQVSVGQGTKLGPFVYLERGCSIGHNVTLRNTIVLDKTHITAEQIITDAICTHSKTIR